MDRAAKALWFLGFAGFVLPISACGGTSDFDGLDITKVCDNGYEKTWGGNLAALGYTDYMDECRRICEEPNWRDLCLGLLEGD